MAKGKNRQFQGSKKKGRAREFREREVRRQKQQQKGLLDIIRLEAALIKEKMGRREALSETPSEAAS